MSAHSEHDPWRDLRTSAVEYLYRQAVEYSILCRKTVTGVHRCSRPHAHPGSCYTEIFAPWPYPSYRRHFAPQHLLHDCDERGCDQPDPVVPPTRYA